MEDNLCEYYLEHKGSDPIGDNHIFLYGFGELLMCDNYDCRYGNNSGGKLLIEGDNEKKFLVNGEKPDVGVCLSKGLKKVAEGEEEIGSENLESELS